MVVQTIVAIFWGGGVKLRTRLFGKETATKIQLLTTINAIS